MNKKLVLGIASILAVATLLGGCGGGNGTAGNGEKKKIRMTYAASEIDGINQELDVIFADFYAEHPEAEIVLEEGGSTMMAKIAANDAPDIIRVSAATDIPTFANRNIIMPLDDMLAKSELFDKDDIFPLALKAFTYDGKDFGKGNIYGLPKDWTPDLMWVNKALFDEAGISVPTLEDPMTYSELSAAVKALTKKDGNDISVFGLNDITGGKPYRAELMLNLMGKSMWSEDYKKVKLDDPEVRAAFRYIYDMEINGYAPSEIHPIDGAGLADFPKGKIGIFNAGLWVGGGFAKAEGATVSVDDMIACPPAVADGTNKIVTSGSPTGAVIYAKTENPELVFDCWEFIHLGKPAEIRASKALNLPVKKSVAAKVAIDNEFLMKNFNFVTKMSEECESITVRSNPYVSNSGVSGVITKYYIPMLNGQFSFDEAMDKMQSELQILIDEGVENF